MTGAGLRRVHCDDLNGRQAMASASMGKVRVADLDVTQRRGTADVGNPHLVIVVDDLASVDAESEGTRLQSVRPGGVNVEWIQMTGDGVLDLVVFERGVGLTLACGSGSCAAAVVARSLGLTSDAVEVRNPGGTLGVTLTGDEATLSGMVSHVADLIVPLERVL